MIEYALELIEVNKRTKDPYLDLGKCGFEYDEIPDELLECTWLEVINFGPGGWSREGRWQECENYEQPNKFSGDEFYSLRHLPNLKELSISECEISEINFVSDLPGLTKLDIAFNRIADIQPLEGLTQLQYLSIGDNRISNIRVLKKLTALTVLSIFKLNLTDLTPIAGLTKLQSLYASNNQIKDLEPLKLLINLEHLNLENNEINYLSPLDGLTRLESLCLSDNKIDYLGPLSKMTCLTELELAHNRIEYLDTLRYIQSLRKIDLRHNKFEFFHEDLLNSLPHLWQLRLDGNRIKNLSAYIVNQFNCLTELKRHFKEASAVATSTVSNPAPPEKQSAVPASQSKKPEKIALIPRTDKIVSLLLGSCAIGLILIGDFWRGLGIAMAVVAVLPLAFGLWVRRR
jgi:Leucine-rich repeat (LRR) protein